MLFHRFSSNGAFTPAADISMLAVANRQLVVCLSDEVLLDLFTCDGGRGLSVTRTHL